MTPIPPTPTAQSPEWISPTLLASYSRCPARAGFERDPQFKSLRRTGLRAALGQVAHAALERRGSGDTFQQAWDQETQTVQRKLATEWAPAVPPSPPSWPGWALTLTRVGVRWPEAAGGGLGSARAGTMVRASAPQRAAEERESTPGPLPWRERWLHDPRTGLAGRPDLVERADGELRVIDFKTGPTQAEPTDVQKEQLLFYSDLVMRMLGELPDSAAIEDASGVRHAVTVTADEVAAVRGRAQAALADLREAAEGRSALVARPNEENCSICPFRVVCADFLDAYAPDWHCGHVRVGRITGMGDLGDREVVDVEVVAPFWAPSRMRLVGFPFPKEKSPGQIWSFSDFEGPNATGMARWNTLVARWPVSAPVTPAS